jgi:hypothetical protein
MNTTPRTPITSRLYAVVAAVAITLAMLTGIDTLAGHGAPLHMAATAAQTQPAA